MTAGLKLCKKRNRKSSLSRPGTLKISKLLKMSSLNWTESPIRYQNTGPPWHCSILTLEKVIERVREYFVTRIKALRVPNANAQHIQQTGFLRMKELFLFMAHHSIQLTDEIAQAYVNTMRWYYLSHFQRYHRSLEKLKMHVMEKYDTLGQEDSTKRSGLGFLFPLWLR